MKFKLSMNEITNLVLTHIETQYGRKTGRVSYIIDGKLLDVEVEDIGPMPKDTPAPDLKSCGDDE